MRPSALSVLSITGLFCVAIFGIPFGVSAETNTNINNNNTNNNYVYAYGGYTYDSWNRDYPYTMYPSSYGSSYYYPTQTQYQYQTQTQYYDRYTPTVYSPYYSTDDYRGYTPRYAVRGRRSFDGPCTVYGEYARANPRDVSGCRCMDGYAWNPQGTECVPYDRRQNIPYSNGGCYLSTGEWSYYWHPDCTCYTNGVAGRWTMYRQCEMTDSSFCSRIDPNAYYDAPDAGCYCKPGYKTDTTRRYCIFFGSQQPVSKWERELRY